MAADEKKYPENDIVARALKRGQKAHDHWAEIYEKAKDDLRFLSDEPGSQWDAEDYDFRSRNSMPALQIDQLRQFVNQVSNNVRMNTPSINVIPSDEVASMEVAEIHKGIIKEIEYSSKADDAYDNACNSAIKCGIGFIRIDHEYKDGDTFDQRICIKRVVNPFSVMIDPNSIEPDAADARWMMVFDEMSEEDFEREYPKAQPVSFSANGIEDEHEKGKCVKIVEYFEIEEVPYLIGLRPDGIAERVTENGSYIRTREAKERVVKRYKLSGKDVLEEGIFPGKHIPIVPVYGEEAWEGSKRRLVSLVRPAKDAQRMYNYWKSSEADALMRSNKSTAIAPVGTTEDFAEDWLNPNKAGVLRYKAVQAPNGQFVPAPTLTPPAPVPVGYVQAGQAAQMDIKATMGLYNAFVGDRSNETSGVAINARKIEGDRAVYHFGDNLVRSINQIGRIIVSMIGVIYDTPKVVTIIDDAGESKPIGINGMMVEGQEQPIFLSQGQYSVKVTTGPDLPTMRQEMTATMQEMITRAPELVRVIGDIYYKNQSFPGAQAVAERIKAILLPEVKATLDDENADPQAVAMQHENEQLKAAIVQMQQEMQSKQAELQMKQQEIALKAQGEAKDNQLEVAKLQLEEAKITAEVQIKQRELSLKEAELLMRKTELKSNGVEMQSSEIHYDENGRRVRE